mgnify:CR=1 FL=1|jgi:2-(1,2-epoxy-1,2-dihydrophenyl)acetyl-CoA isomerase
MSAEQHVQTELVDGIATITLNRPEALNALSPRMTDALIEHTASAECDDRVRCLVLRGNGRAFMAGGDVKGMREALTTDREGHLARTEMRVLRAHQFVAQLRRMRKPVLAAVQGPVAGIGLGISLAADFVVARDDAYFLMAYRHIGLSADGGATYFLPRLVGERRALEYALLGDRIPAAEALACGLVNRVVPAAQFEAVTADIARRLADGPTRALGAVKQLIRTSFESTWDQHSHREAESIAAAAATQDHLEGVTAFVEKRRPVFAGR